MTLTKKGFTMVELIVVVAMIAIFMAAVGTAVGKAHERARIEKARNEVKVISQAILAWENYNRGGKTELEEITDQPADANTLAFLLGQGGTAKSGEIPALLMAQLSAGGVILDPWGKPYLVRVKGKGGGINAPENLNLSTCYFLPNFYRLSEEERK